jgi:hypothetical protein
MMMMIARTHAAQATNDREGMNECTWEQRVLSAVTVIYVDLALLPMTLKEEGSRKGEGRGLLVS